MNPKRQRAGRKGGRAGRGQSKARPLDPGRASAMAWLRWHGKERTKTMTKQLLNPDEKMVCPNCGEDTEGKAREFLIPKQEFRKQDHRCYNCDLEWVAWMEDGKIHVISKF